MSETDIFKEDLTKDALTELKELCDKQKRLEKEVEQAEEFLKNKKLELQEVSFKQIPDLLNNFGLSEIRLSSGEKLEIKDKVKASISNKNYRFAYQSMIEEDGKELVDMLFREEIKLNGIEDNIIDLLIKNNVVYESEFAIHPSTLKKYCADKLAAGKKIPEGITCYTYKETKIK